MDIYIIYIIYYKKCKHISQLFKNNSIKSDKEASMCETLNTMESYEQDDKLRIWRSVTNKTVCYEQNGKLRTRRYVTNTIESYEDDGMLRTRW